MKSLCLIIAALVLFSFQTGCVYDPPQIVKIPICGNGTIEPGETCDDGNTVDGDSCSSACQIELGWNCSGGACATKCGDGITSGKEECDDGNTKDNDGCSKDCKIESGSVCHFDSNTTATCTDVHCGNGVPDGTNQCDDGNQDDGDGCSSLCQIETNWQCVRLIDDVANPPDVAAIPMVFRLIGKDNFVKSSYILGGFGCPIKGAVHVLPYLVDGVPYTTKECSNDKFNKVFNEKHPLAKYTRFLPFSKQKNEEGQWFYQFSGYWTPFDRVLDGHSKTARELSTNSHYSTGVIHLVIDKSKVPSGQKFYVSIADDLYVALNGKLVINQAGYNAVTNRNFFYSLDQAPGSGNYVRLDIFLSKRNASYAYLIQIPTAIVGPSICKSDSDSCGDGKIEPAFKKDPVKGWQLNIPDTVNACDDNNTFDNDICSAQCTYHSGYVNCQIDRNGSEIAETCQKTTN